MKGESITLAAQKKSAMWFRIYLGFEFLVLFFGVPLFIYFEKKIIHPTVILLPVLVIIFLILRYSTSFKWRELFTLSVPRKFIWQNILAVFITAVFLAGFVYIFNRPEFLNLPRGNFGMWCAMCLFYPTISSWGQEIIYRTFLYRRYRKVYINKWGFIALSAIAFSFLHIVYYHPLSMILTLIMGFYIAWIYEKTKSVLFATILHGALGITVFTVGLGQYFWLDMMQYLGR